MSATAIHCHALVVFQFELIHIKTTNRYRQSKEEKVKDLFHVMLATFWKLPSMEMRKQSNGDQRWLNYKISRNHMTMKFSEIIAIPHV